MPLGFAFAGADECVRPYTSGLEMLAQFSEAAQD